MNDLKESYFNWLCNIVHDSNHRKYESLLYLLFNTDYSYRIPMDGNRYEDGIELRYQFGNENHIRESQIATGLDIFPCSVLEMMVALASRCEEMVCDYRIGDRTATWFWDMVDNLGLDPVYGEKTNSDILEKFLNNDYESNGRGGLFIINGKGDIRKVEIWYQAMWYFCNLLKEEMTL